MSATRQSVKLATLLGAVALAILPIPAGPAQGAEENFGFTSEAKGAPVAVLLYEPASGIPVPPDEPHLQGTFSYTSTILETGPKSRALASSIWPGAAVGDGFATLCDYNDPETGKTVYDCEQDWFARSVSQQPGGEKEHRQEVEPLSAGMYTRANGLDVYAEADSGNAPPPFPFSFGNGASNSTSTVEKGFAVARTVATAEDIELLAGVIKIGSVTTSLEALSNLDGAKASGVTTVNGLTIAGNGYTVDAKGLHPIQDNEEQQTPLPGPPQEVPGEEELRSELGISVYMEEHKSYAQNTTASREAAGLRISIETARLRERFDEGPLYPLLEQLPKEFDELQAPLYQFLAAAPRIDFVFGRGYVESASVVPYKFPDIDPIDPVDPVEPSTPTTTTPPTTTPPSTGTSGGPGISSVGGGSPSSSVAGPQVASSAARPGQVGQPIAAGPAFPTEPAGAQGPALFAGLPPGLVIGALAAAALAAKALGGFAATAMGGGGGPLCSAGARKNVPNLRDL